MGDGAAIRDLGPVLDEADGFPWVYADDKGKAILRFGGGGISGQYETEIGEILGANWDQAKRLAAKIAEARTVKHKRGL